MLALIVKHTFSGQEVGIGIVSLITIGLLEDRTLEFSSYPIRRTPSRKTSRKQQLVFILECGAPTS